MKELFSIEEIKKEMTHYVYISNAIVGIVFVTLFLGALGTDSPQQTAFLLLPIAGGALHFMSTNFPPTIQLITEMSKQKEYIDDREELKRMVKKIYNNNNFKWKSMFSTNIIYMYGFVLYFALLIIPEFGYAVKKGTFLTKTLSILF